MFYNVITCFTKDVYTMLLEQVNIFVQYVEIQLIKKSYCFSKKENKDLNIKNKNKDILIELIIIL